MVLPIPQIQQHTAALRAQGQKSAFQTDKTSIHIHVMGACQDLQGGRSFRCGRGSLFDHPPRGADQSGRIAHEFREAGNFHRITRRRYRRTIQLPAHPHSILLRLKNKRAFRTAPCHLTPQSYPVEIDALPPVGHQGLGCCGRSCKGRRRDGADQSHILHFIDQKPEVMGLLAPVVPCQADAAQLHISIHQSLPVRLSKTLDPCFKPTGRRCDA